jgi:phenylpropionate dioxygenase-like ring-hydroxylating dioxygenase large terminal subunit
VLGKRLVFWCDGDANWRAFEDRCPHRAVALSEGRVEGGELHCAYHGWQWNGARLAMMHTLVQRGDAAKLAGGLVL